MFYRILQSKSVLISNLSSRKIFLLLPVPESTLFSVLLLCNILPLLSPVLHSVLFLQESFIMSSLPSSSLTHASSLVLKCGVSPCLLGFKYLVHAVSLYSFLSAPPLSSVYRDTASFFSVSLKSVSRDISYALRRADNIHSLLSSLVGIPIPSYEIRSGFVISHLALILRNSSISDNV